MNVTDLPTNHHPRVYLEQRLAFKAFELIQAIKNGVMERRHRDYFGNDTRK